MIKKSCIICQQEFLVYPSTFERRKTCSKECCNKNFSIQSKGKRKGIHYSPATEFKKGHNGFRKKYTKGVHYSLKTEFKKGLIPWNKGKVGVMPIPWNKGLGDGSRTDRMKQMNSLEYIEWRETIFKRDNYTCQECNQKGGKLQADHIKMWSLFPELRYEISNGQTLCKNCHKEKTQKEISIYWQNQYTISRELKKVFTLKLAGIK